MTTMEVSASDLLGLTARLVNIPSVSRDERAIADHVEAMLAEAPWLEVTRVNNSLVARTPDRGRDRLMLAGHIDTVPPNGNERAVVDGDVLWGIGSADMKSGVAVLLSLATSVADPSVDVTYVFYECEELSDAKANGIERLFNERPDVMGADAAILAEPTGAQVEAGCQGSMWIQVTMTGTRAHTARPWRGSNAVHRLSTVLASLHQYEGRQVTIDGCEFREALQAVAVSGGVAVNVVPDLGMLTLNHRFAPDRSPGAAAAHVRDVLGQVDGFEVGDVLTAAPPTLSHPLLASLLTATGKPARAKLGWTDVARFVAHGVPATNYGPGDPSIAHSAAERVTRADLDSCYRTFRALIR